MRLEWKPIETAPMNGDEVMLWEADCKHIAIGCWCSGDLGGWRGVNGEPLEPTHWDELPKGPNGETGTSY